MQFCCLGSGSKGNATLIEYQDTLIMLDCGFGIKHTLSRLEAKERQIHDVSAIVVTHEHGDHIAGVEKISRKYEIPVYATRGTAKTGKLDRSHEIFWIVPDSQFSIGQIDIQAVTVPHDANEPCQFVFEGGGRRLGIMTDLGSISSHVQKHYTDLDGLLLESNHDLDMLWRGKYPQSLKYRVAGEWGHLSNEQAMSFLSNTDLSRLKTLVLGHISQENNCDNLVKEYFRPIEEHVENVYYACQEKGFPWINI